MKRILLSLLTVGAVGALAFGASQAFFSDTETSQDNTFIAGELDLKVDSECHYWQDDSDIGCGTGEGNGNWALSDLVPGVHKFFNFDDVKPGDYGEDTVSLHVFDNDAWGKLVISGIVDSDNGCTEPEGESSDLDCNPTPAPGDGELRENLSFWVWLDQGAIAGFQNMDSAGNPIDADPVIPDIQLPDPTEGDNIWQDDESEPALITPGQIDSGGETHNIWQGLALADVTYDGPGLTADGHMVGSITYYFGIGWDLPDTVGNEVQSDIFGADMTFEVEQYRNNPTPFGP